MTRLLVHLLLLGAASGPLLAQPSAAPPAASAAQGIAVQVQALRARGEALAKAGDVERALAAYHDERALADQLAQAARAAALNELRARYDRDAQERSIDALRRHNAVQAAELQTQALDRQLWLIAGAAVALALLLALPLLLRLRRINRALASHESRLRRISERDALTGLANRRSAMRLLRAQCRDRGGFEGGLLLLDIDHFKQVNDRHGHAAGDAVLVEVARRLQATLRTPDTAIRWGGEEFLVVMPAGGMTRSLARRLLHAVADTPIGLPDGGTLRVTVSIGHAGLPMPAHRLALGIDAAVEVADKALYVAKSVGRHRAVGVEHTVAADARALAVQLEDLAAASRDGRVRLSVEAGAPIEAVAPPR